MEFTIQPNIYTTRKGGASNLLSHLEHIWIDDLTSNDFVGKGSMYVLSGFSNFNGGVRFYPWIQDHIQRGDKCRIILGGSSSQNMSSRQIVGKLLDIGCDVGIVNRKAIFHAKCYGFKYQDFSSLVVSSGNFTSKGMTQNIEASMLLDHNDMKGFSFDWDEMFKTIQSQKIEYYPVTPNPTAPFWKLLFDEEKGRIQDDKDDSFQTLLITLSNSDTARIQAQPGTDEGKGSQYFWLSKDSYDFFPALTIPNKRGYKRTFSTLISMDYIDLGLKGVEERVTFEAENNLDFRLGTGQLRYSSIAQAGDLAAITRRGEHEYELRIFHADSHLYKNLLSYAINFIGHQGKRYGYLDNTSFYMLLKKYGYNNL